jgi:hypothetical protein
MQQNMATPAVRPAQPRPKKEPFFTPMDHTPFARIMAVTKLSNEIEKQLDIDIAKVQALTKWDLGKMTKKRAVKGLPKLSRDDLYLLIEKKRAHHFAILHHELQLATDALRALPNTYMPNGSPQLASFLAEAHSSVKIPEESEVFFLKATEEELLKQGHEEKQSEVEKFIIKGLKDLKQNATGVYSTIKILAMEPDDKGVLQQVTKVIMSKVYPTTMRPEVIVSKMIDTGYEGATVIGIRLHFTSPGNERIVRLADYALENCLINVLRINTNDSKIDKLYKKFPELRPQENKKIYVTDEQMTKIAKFTDTRLRIYTPLGLKINEPWCEYGYANRKVVDVLIENEHATIIPSRHVDQVVYVNTPVIAPDNPKAFYKNKTTIKDDEGKEHFITNFYIMRDEIRALLTKKVIKSPNKDVPETYDFDVTNRTVTTLYKAFRPSEITNNLEDDNNPDYFYYYNAHQIFSALFCKENKLFPPKNSVVREVIINAERFIGRAKLTAIIPSTAIAIDHNRHYSCAEYNPFYIGYPEDSLVISNDLQDAVYIVGTLNNAPSEYKTFFSEQERVFTRPEYNYLISRNAVIDIEYTINAPLRHVSIYDWCETKHIQGNGEKLFINSLIGRLITGGIKQEEPKIIEFGNKQERDRLMAECARLNLVYKIVFYDEFTDNNTPNMLEEETPNEVITEAQLCPRGYIRVTVPSPKVKGKFNFHSYLMAYASIAMYIKLRELNDNDCVLHAYNVDCLVISNETYEIKSETEKNLWKIEKVKPHYHQFTQRPHTPHLKLPNVTPPARKVHIKHTAVIAAAGLGKSYEHLTDPAINQVYTTPTHDLKNNLKSTYNNLMLETAHKIFQFTVKDDKTWLGMIKQHTIPHPGAVLILDELTMYDQDQIKTIIRRANMMNTIIVALGDFCQITQNINGAAITQDFIKEYFAIETKERTPESHARHAFEYGTELDTLRIMSIEDQLNYIIATSNKYKLTKTFDDVINEYSLDAPRVVVSCHQQAFNYHQRIHQMHPDKQILCRYREKNLIHEQLVDITSEAIWWGRTRMGDQLPKDKKYEPAYATTVDSFQGKTQHVIIDTHNMTRHGVLYTAITRSPTRPWIIATS